MLAVDIVTTYNKPDEFERHVNASLLLHNNVIDIKYAITDGIMSAMIIYEKKGEIK